MLGLGGDNMLLVLLALAIEARHALDAHVVAFGGTAGKHHLLGAGPDQTGHLRSGGFHHFLSLPTI